MIVINYLICLIALVLLGYETWLVLKRNRKIDLKGKDDFFTFCLVLLFASLILRPDEHASFVVAMRNMLILMVIIFSLAVKRGINEQGILKLGFMIPWSKVAEVYISSYQMTKLVVTFSTQKRRFKLFYPKYQLKKLIYEIQKYHPDVMVEEDLNVI
ncbi:MAG: hypothetical protein HFJ10_11705 [Lachnospiraceae bacterium]|nr:hypothetical protein [Lachnospiraceae bacterium]